MRTIILLIFALPLSADRIVIKDHSLFLLKDKSITRYNLEKGSLEEEIGFFGKPKQLLSNREIYLLTDQAIFKLDPNTGKFIDIFPLNKYSYAMALDEKRERLYLLTANDITIYDVAKKLSPLYSIAIPPREAYPIIDRETGRLYLIRGDYPWLGFLKPGSRRLKRLKFPKGIERAIIYNQKILGIAGSVLFVYNPNKGKVITSISLGQPLKDIAQKGSYLVVAGNSALFLIDPNNYKVLKRIERNGVERISIAGDRLLSIEGRRVVIFKLPDFRIIGKRFFDKEVTESRVYKNKILALSGDEIISGDIKIEKERVPDSLYSLQVGAFIEKDNLLALEEELKRRGIGYYTVYEMGMHKLRVGYFKSKEEAKLFSYLLDPYPSWALYDKIQKIEKPKKGLDFDKDGNFEFVVNPEGERVIIFSLKDRIYEKVWESDPDKKCRVIKIEESGVLVEIEGKEYTIKGEKGRFEIE